MFSHVVSYVVNLRLNTVQKLFVNTNFFVFLLRLIFIFLLYHAQPVKSISGSFLKLFFLLRFFFVKYFNFLKDSLIIFFLFFLLMFFSLYLHLHIKIIVQTFLILKFRDPLLWLNFLNWNLLIVLFSPKSI